MSEADEVIEAMVGEYHETFNEGPHGAMRRVLRAALETLTDRDEVEAFEVLLDAAYGEGGDGE